MHTLPRLPEDELLSISKEGMEYILKHFDPQRPERNFLWTTDYRVELPVRVKKDGPGSEKPYTLCEMWQMNIDQIGNLNALNFQRSPNEWVSLTYRQYYKECQTFAKALISLGITEYTSINIIGFNSVEWAVSFFGSIFGHYLPVGIYTTNGPDAVQYIANHSEAELIVLQDQTHLRKYIKVIDKVSRIKYYILYKGDVPKDIPQCLESKVLTWKQFMNIGETKYNPKRKEDTLEYREAVQKPGNCATFIYTSGTTGPPKAVMISHDNYTWITDTVGRRFGFEEGKLGKGRFLSLLPLSHVAAQMVDLIVCPRYGFSLFFPDASALQGNLIRFLHVCRPTFFVSVPRVWEKIEERITAVASQITGLKRNLAAWAREKSPMGTLGEINNKPLPGLWRVAKLLLFDKIKESLGLDQCEIFIFSAAPLKESTRLFFVNLNIFLHNCYGMSELAGPQTFTNPQNWSSFTSEAFLKEAGQCLDGAEISIANPDAEGNGEICLRGRNVFMGYFKNEMETVETIDSRGFVHSGDVGILSSNKSLSITGRIKELLITAGGENVAPVLIENQIHTFLPIFSTVVVIGDKLKYLTCLLCLKLKDKDTLAQEVVQYIRQRGSKAVTVKEAMECQELHKIIQQGIGLANQKAISNAQKVQKFKVLPVEFTVDSGLLTPTLKLKRKVILQKFEAEIASLYQDPKL